MAFELSGPQGMLSLSKNPWPKPEFDWSEAP
ncbi:hypothetical protein CCACVL1_11352 [Corchorus capsularis]|uniref:Uncharacterized protein n=1 Tax=Corchorus capsularis TaxID=210143 RepID=A0A1R3ILV5_COCAP|nr:hypothetical protein CCACVL1_11352 [Corchorus capsularis]